MSLWLIAKALLPTAIDLDLGLMKRSVKIIFLMLAISLPVTQAFGSYAFHADELTGRQDLRWRSKVVRLAVSRSLIGEVQSVKFGTDVTAALERSVRTWEAATGIRFQIVASDRLSVSPAAAKGDGISLITIAQTAENIQFLGADILELPGATRVFFDRNGFITEGDIVLNPIHQFSSDGTFGTFDLESVLTHEIGHVLGIGHSDIPSAVMSEHLQANGVFGIANFSRRELTPVDASLARSVYGTAEAVQDCCSSISGSLKNNSRDQRPVRGFVWVEDSETNLIVGSAPVAEDGSYSVNGLVSGNYSVFFSGYVGEEGHQQLLGRLELEKGRSDGIVTELAASESTISFDSIGTNGDLVKTSIPAIAGTRLTVSVGGGKLQLQDIFVGFRSPFFTVVPSTFISREHPDGSSVISFEVIIDPDTLPGSYSLIGETLSGERAYLPGAILVARPDIATSK